MFCHLTKQGDITVNVVLQIIELWLSLHLQLCLILCCIQLLLQISQVLVLSVDILETVYNFLFLLLQLSCKLGFDFS